MTVWKAALMIQSFRSCGNRHIETSFIVAPILTLVALSSPKFTTSSKFCIPTQVFFAAKSPLARHIDQRWHITWHEMTHGYNLNTCRAGLAVGIQFHRMLSNLPNQEALNEDTIQSRLRAAGIMYYKSCSLKHFEPYKDQDKPASTYLIISSDREASKNYR